jgi:hypothetical protein
MILPKLALAALPDLSTLTGMFGSLAGGNHAHGDSIVLLATFIYDAQPPGGGGLL